MQVLQAQVPVSNPIDNGTHIIVRNDALHQINKLGSLSEMPHQLSEISGTF